MSTNESQTLVFGVHDVVALDVGEQGCKAAILTNLQTRRLGKTATNQSLPKDVQHGIHAKDDNHTQACGGEDPMGKGCPSPSLSFLAA